jgi:hypothetical protein
MNWRPPPPKHKDRRHPLNQTKGVKMLHITISEEDGKKTNFVTIPNWRKEEIQSYLESITNFEDRFERLKEKLDAKTELLRECIDYLVDLKELTNSETVFLGLNTLLTKLEK